VKRQNRGLWNALAATAIFAAATVCSETTAHANDPATAQALFDQARKLMTQEKWAEACPKLEESQRLDPGGGTLLHLALCREHEGKIATAWAHYQDALAWAKRDGRKDRVKIAQPRIDALTPRLHRMRVRVAPKSRKLAGFAVSRDEANGPRRGLQTVVGEGGHPCCTRRDRRRHPGARGRSPSQPGRPVLLGRRYDE
jgi:hypothetical protein